MNDTDWELIVALYKEKNITKTAARLYISQPAVTKRLQTIEKQLGIQIVERDHKGIRFTMQGKYLVKYSEEMIERWKTLKRNLDNMAKDIKKTFKIGACNNFARKILPEILSKYQKKYPNVKFEIMTGWNSDVYKMLCNKEVEIALIKGNYEWSQGEEVLFEDTFCAINSESIDIADLPEMKRIEYDTDVRIKDILDNWWMENFSTPPVKGMTVDRSDTCKEMVMQGLGFALVPGYVLEEKDELFKIQLMKKNGEPLKRNVRMLYYESFKENSLAQAFIDTVNSVDFSKYKPF